MLRDMLKHASEGHMWILSQQLALRSQAEINNLQHGITQLCAGRIWLCHCLLFYTKADQMCAMKSCRELTMQSKTVWKPENRCKSPFGELLTGLSPCMAEMVTDLTGRTTFSPNCRNRQRSDTQSRSDRLSLIKFRVNFGAPKAEVLAIN